MTEIPVFELILADDEDGVYAMSLVNEPAYKTAYIALSRQTEVIKLSKDETKYTLTGPAIIANQLVYRKSPTIGEYYFYATPEVIRATAERFFKKGYQNNSKNEHEINLDSNTIYESWIIEDPNTDKSTTLGYNLPKGTWMISMKVNDKDYWENEIMTGKRTGFSIDSFFNLKNTGKQEPIGLSHDVLSQDVVKEELLNSNNETKNTETKMTFFEGIVNKLHGKTQITLNEVTPEETKSAPVELATTEYILEDGQKISVDLGESLMKNVVDAEGKVIGVLKFETVTAEAPAETGAPVDNPSDLLLAAQKPNDELLKAINDMQSVLLILKADNEKLNKEIVAIKTTAINPAKPVVEQEIKLGKQSAEVDHGAVLRAFLQKNNNKQ